MALALTSAAALASPFAVEWTAYDPGQSANPSYLNPTAALGAAGRVTGSGDFISGVTPFNPPFNPDQLVSIGTGGHIDLRFDRTITDAAHHRFGVDLIVFGSAFFVDQSYTDADPTNDGSGILGDNPALFGGNGVADVYVSQDGVDWRLAATTALNLFPTLGYADYTQATPLGPGSVESDFTRAMDPTLGLSDLAGMDFSDLVALYDGSGGGVGIDISGTGLDWAAFVRIENNSASAFSIDAVAVVPAPGALTGLGVGLGLAVLRRRA